MAAANFSRDVLERFDMFDKYVTIDDNKGKKKNKWRWMIIGTLENCRKRCKGAFCDEHLREFLKWGREPLPCFVCWVAAINPDTICRSCRLAGKTMPWFLEAYKDSFEN